MSPPARAVTPAACVDPRGDPLPSIVASGAPGPARSGADLAAPVSSFRTRTHPAIIEEEISDEIPFTRGFTLIELLVVIAIIAVLIALSAAGRAVGARGRPPRPVHQQSQADRPGRPQLRVHQRQFPMGISANPQGAPARRSGATRGAASAPALMLPYLEQTPMYQAANFSWGPWVNNDTVNNAVISAFLCPSDPGPRAGPGTRHIPSATTPATAPPRPSSIPGGTTATPPPYSAASSPISPAASSPMASPTASSP